VSSRRPISQYYDEAAIRAQVARGDHRSVVGGLWQEIGQLQFDFLKGRGLQPAHRLLDIGCGCLRGGVHFVRYLDSGNYFGTDLSQALLDAGLEEIAANGLVEKLPRGNLVLDAEFSFAGLPPQFEFAIAVSVFTHLPLNLIRVCLERLAPELVNGGLFYATFFEIADDFPTWRTAEHRPGGVVTTGAGDPYHYRLADFLYVAKGLPWQVRPIGDFGHPRGQRMLEFEKI
jgi:hypothetical protein